MIQKWLILFLTAALFSITAPGAVFAQEKDDTGGGRETQILLSDTKITVDGQSVSQDASQAVYTGAEIVYYRQGQGSSYGEGTTADEHSEEEALLHTVVTITQPGTYRITGRLSRGQIAVDLGEEAKEDPNAVVTLILDGADISCSVAPAVIFYNVYECGNDDVQMASSQVDTSGAGANVILADDSVNKIEGAYVARIYKEGSTDKLHKYDGAFYSRMSMNVDGETKGNGELHITASNEGLDSELHLTINGGEIWIQSQDDGINTNEDNVSVTTINGGYLYINGGLGTEGDGIDSNGYLVINGGTVISSANAKSGDGGLDADCDILLNGGTVVAFGGRNDAVSSRSAQPFIELSFAQTKEAGEILRMEKEDGTEIFTFAADRAYQSVTFTSDQLIRSETYYVYTGGSVAGAEEKNGFYDAGGSYSGGTRQQYTASGSGMISGFGGGKGRPQNGEPGAQDAGEQPPKMPENQNGQSEMPQEPPFVKPDPSEGGETGRPEMPQGNSIPEGDGSQGFLQGSVEFTLTEETYSFSGISDADDTAGKTAVTFSVNGGKGIDSVSSGETVSVTQITARERDSGEEASVSQENVQITVTDLPSEDYAKTCLLSDGMEALEAILPEADGTYQLTISVLSRDEQFTGTTLLTFSVGERLFTDLSGDSPYYDAACYLCQKGIFLGTGQGTFQPDQTMTRGMLAEVLYRMQGSPDIAITEQAFSDVQSESWYAAAVSWAKEEEVLLGIYDGVFGADQAVTTEQLATALYRLEIKNGNQAELENADLQEGQTCASEYAREAVSWAYGEGILQGENGVLFNPQDSLTRAEAALILAAYLQR